MNRRRAFAIHLSALCLAAAGMVAASTSAAKAQLLPGATCFPNMHGGQTCVNGNGASRQFVQTYAGYPAPLGGPNGPVGNILMYGDCRQAKPVSAIFLQGKPGPQLVFDGYCGKFKNERQLSIQELRASELQRIQEKNQQKPQPDLRRFGYPDEYSCRSARRQQGLSESVCD